MELQPERQKGKNPSEPRQVETVSLHTRNPPPSRVGWKTDDTFCFASLWFLRLLGFIYLSAFVSLWVQLDGLIGSNGILPAAEYVEAVRNHFEGRIFSAAIWKAPSAFFFGANDLALHVGCILGCLFSVLLMAAILPPLTALVLWVLYLSFTSVAGTFFGFQWDNLLLEVGLLAVFLPPMRVLPTLKNGWKPRVWVLWLYRFLLFRLMFSSGYVKLRPEGQGENTWANLTAMNFHYETQPLPTVFSWYAHQLPEWFDKTSVGVTLLIQLVIPFFVFGPAICRRTASAILVFLQILILTTGNYCFFNLLAVALCLLLIDDRLFSGFLRGWSCRLEILSPDRQVYRWTRLIFSKCLFALFLLLASYQLIGTLYVPPSFLKPISEMDSAIAPFRSFNSYGLFANMTTSRPEIIVQGSKVGETWQDYEFIYKPGDLNRAPKWNAPHQPRLDWQMWFAALGDVRSSRNQWFLSFVTGLLQGREEVARLLESNPFSTEPPKYIRALVYDYHFTEMESGDINWWRRGEPRLYCPTVTLDESGRLRAQGSNF